MHCVPANLARFVSGLSTRGQVRRLFVACNAFRVNYSQRQAMNVPIDIEIFVMIAIVATTEVHCFNLLEQ
jgi:hypothetical protein